MDATITRISDAAIGEYRAVAAATDAARPAGFVEIARFDQFHAQLSSTVRACGFCVGGAAA